MRDYDKLHIPQPNNNVNIKSPQDLVNFLNQKYFTYNEKAIYYEILDFRDDNNTDVYGIRFRKWDAQQYAEDLIADIEEDNIIKVIYEYPDSWSYTYVLKVPVELNN